MIDSWDHLVPKFDGDQRHGIRRLRSPQLTKLRHRLAGEQNWHCAYCGVIMKIYDGSPTSVTVDHIIPYSKGGFDNWYNLVAACFRCNVKKSDMDGLIFYEFYINQYVMEFYL